MRNLELKARCADLEAARERAARLGARRAADLEQRDTFFAAGRGRLKLRELGDGTAELIAYRRPDTASARGSDYELCPVDQAAPLARVLAHALGTTGVAYADLLAREAR
jgi:adenylate cyclase class IV